MDWVPENARVMLSQLVEMSRRLGRDPTFTEVELDPTTPAANSYAYYFGSFTKAVREAHRIAFVRDNRKPPLPVGKKTFKKEENTMSRRAITTEEYVIGAIRLQKELGHFPEATDIMNDKRSPSVSSYMRRYGTSWVALKAVILNKAKELGINEDNVDSYQPHEPEVEYAAKTIPGSEDEPKDSPAAIPEPGESLEPPAESCPPATIIEPTKSGIALPSVLSMISADPILSSEVEPEGNKLISLYPQTRIISPKVEGYAAAFIADGVIPLNKTVLDIPVSRECSRLSLVLGGQILDFPAPQEGVFYIVERKIVIAAKIAGRTTCDLLIPKKYNTDEDGMKITEFLIL